MTTKIKHKADTILIGLTGGIASGKTEVAAVLQKLGSEVISADEIGKEVMEESSEMLEWVRETFGDEYFDPQGRLQRSKLGDLVFSQPDKKKLLDDKIFPLIYQRLKEKISEAEEDFYVITVDAAMIYEWGIKNDFDIILTVVSPVSEIYNRLSARNGFKGEQIGNRIRSQLPPEDKASQSHWVIHNEGSLRDLRQQVHRFWDVMIEPRLTQNENAGY